MTTFELDHPRTGHEHAARLRALGSAVGARVARALPRVVLLSWLAFVFAIFAFEPAANEDAVVPLWADLALAGFWLGLLAAAVLALVGAGRAALRMSALVGCVGLVVGYSCHSTSHHLGAWWLIETGCCAAIGLASGVALVARRP